MALVIFIVLLCLQLVNMDTIFMKDAHGLTYECETSSPWIKGCRLYDFSNPSCRPWELSGCPEPFIQQRLSPCPHYECQVQVDYCIFRLNCY